jgi:hypothetical protein
MKPNISLIVLASYIVALAGCSGHSQAASTRPAIDLVQAGKDIEFDGGYLLHVTKREGSSLEGIRILVTALDGQVTEITAETGTIKSGTPENSNFENQVTMTLHNAKTVTSSTNFTAPSVVLVLYKKQQPEGEQDAVLPGRHMSEHQVAILASKALPTNSKFSCEFKDGVWVVSEPQKGVWGVTSATTNADGHVFISSTNALRVVLKVRDADGAVESVNAP